MSAVRKALEAACRTDGLYGIKPEADADIRRDRADAIAAFLRALPTWHDINGRSVSAAYLHTLAAAVTRAAEEDSGDDQ
jgi:hypothetical protein